MKKLNCESAPLLLGHSDEEGRNAHISIVELDLPPHYNGIGAIWVYICFT